MLIEKPKRVGPVPMAGQRRDAHDHHLSVELLADCTPLPLPPPV
jgi:hypothetical protein